MHNRGAVAKMLSSHGCNIEFAPLETPAAIGKVERHGGILKAMVRKVTADTETAGLADFEMLLQECTSTKNNMQRTNGYSASQWVLGKQPRMPGSVTDMSESADLGVIEAKTDPNVAYHKVHARRMSAQRAFVHLDTSNTQCSTPTQGVCCWRFGLLQEGRTARWHKMEHSIPCDWP